MVTKTLLTAEQFFDLPDDNMWHDLVRGEVWSMSLAGREHGVIANWLAYLLTAYNVEHHLGVISAAETGFVLARDPDTALGPDVAFVRTERLPQDTDESRLWPVAPDLAVEVYSPGDRAGEMAGYPRTGDVRAYLDAGVRLVWVVYPKRRVVVVHEPGGLERTMGDDDALDGGSVLPGFSHPVRDLWR